LREEAQKEMRKRRLFFGFGVTANLESMESKEPNHE